MKTDVKNLKNNETTLKINHSFTYCLKMNNFIAGPWLPGHFVGLRLGSDVPEHIAPLRRWASMYRSGECLREITRSVSNQALWVHQIRHVHLSIKSGMSVCPSNQACLLVHQIRHVNQICHVCQSIEFGKSVSPSYKGEKTHRCTALVNVWGK